MIPERKPVALEAATRADLDAVVAFYDEVIEKTPEIGIHARWKKGAHPTVEGLAALIEEGSLYLYREQGAILGAMGFPMYQGEDYRPVAWSQAYPDDCVASIHLFGVRPDRQGAGIGAAMIRSALALAKARGMKAVRLDTLASNTPAQRLYTSLGFVFRGQRHLYAENTGWFDFYFYEYSPALYDKI